MIGWPQREKGISGPVFRSETIEHRLAQLHLHILLLTPGRGNLPHQTPTEYALFVRLDMAHLPAIRAFPLRGLRLARRGGEGGGGFGRGGWGHSAGGFGDGRGGGGGVDAFCFFALVPAFAVLFEARELVGDSVAVSQGVGMGREGGVGACRFRWRAS
jgi:hypothetical protein